MRRFTLHTLESKSVNIKAMYISGEARAYGFKGFWRAGIWRDLDSVAVFFRQEEVLFSWLNDNDVTDDYGAVKAMYNNSAQYRLTQFVFQIA
jgi:hypothetical protein